MSKRLRGSAQKNSRRSLRPRSAGGRTSLPGAEGAAADPNAQLSFDDERDGEGEGDEIVAETTADEVAARVAEEVARKVEEAARAELQAADDLEEAGLARPRGTQDLPGSNNRHSTQARVREPARGATQLEGVYIASSAEVDGCPVPASWTRA